MKVADWKKKAEAIDKEHNKALWEADDKYRDAVKALLKGVGLDGRVRNKRTGEIGKFDFRSEYSEYLCGDEMLYFMALNADAEDEYDEYYLSQKYVLVDGLLELFERA